MKFDLENCKKKYRDLKENRQLNDKLHTINTINEDIGNQCTSADLYNLYNSDYIESWLIGLGFTVEKTINKNYNHLKISGWAD
jgi:hypothetical protein